MQIARLGWLDPVAPVELRQDHRLQKHVRLVDVPDPAKTKLLDQPILEHPVLPLHAALGLGTLRQDQFHLQLLHCPAELRRLAGAGKGLTALVNAVAIHVQAPRHAVQIRPSAKYVHRRFGGLGTVEPRESQAGRVIHDHHQGRPRGRWTLGLKPVVRRAILLQHLAQVLLAFTPLAVPAGLPPPLPQPPFLEDRCQRVGADDQPLLGQLLAGQRRTKIVIAILVEPCDFIARFLSQASVADPPTKPMHQPRITLQAESPPQPPGVTQRNVHQFACFHHGEFLPFDPAQRIEPQTFPCRHKKCFHSGGYTRARGVTLLFELRGHNSTCAQHNADH